MAVPSRARSDFGSHLRRTAPAPSEPDCIDEPKKRWRVFLDGPSILGRLPGFFFAQKAPPRARRGGESFPAVFGVHSVTFAPRYGLASVSGL